MARVAVETCRTCHRKYGELHKATGRSPSLAKLERWAHNGIARATDGCRVEPDGVCEHGHVSWLRRLGYI